ncbi:hypothetical protein RHSP_78303 [Rhizobium freirei PRF 81]|uniref:Uncharacterized protein n=1 Tax=Rhizobium freirei PRF 81 TaxID=363754 RepID=N6TUL7_9HYPH|nr:hypothetical protein RHSP_78303 [Rhizobium freirei PRF 81]
MVPVRPHPYRPHRRIDHNALSAAVDAFRFDQGPERDLRHGIADPVEIRFQRLCPRLVRRAGHLRQIRLEFGRHRRAFGHRQRDFLLAGGLCLRPAEFLGQEFLVCADARHADAALPRHADPAIYPLPQARLGEDDAAARRAEIPRGRCLLHLPDGAVFPRHPARAGRGRHDGRLQRLAHLLAHHAAPVAAGAGNGRHLLLHLDLGRFLRAADLPLGYQHLHGAARTALLRGLHRKFRLEQPVRHVEPVADPGLPDLPLLPEAADRRHRDRRPQTLITNPQSRIPKIWGCEPTNPSKGMSHERAALCRHRPQSRSYLRPGQRHAAGRRRTRRLPCGGGRSRRYLRRALSAGETRRRQTRNPGGQLHCADRQRRHFQRARRPCHRGHAPRQGRDARQTRDGDAGSAGGRAKGTGRNQAHRLHSLFRTFRDGIDRQGRRAGEGRRHRQGHPHDRPWPAPAAQADPAGLVLRSQALWRHHHRHRLASMRTVPVFRRLAGSRGAVGDGVQPRQSRYTWPAGLWRFSSAHA